MSAPSRGEPTLSRRILIARCGWRASFGLGDDLPVEIGRCDGCGHGVDLSEGVGHGEARMSPQTLPVMVGRSRSAANAGVARPDVAARPAARMASMMVPGRRGRPGTPSAQGVGRNLVMMFVVGGLDGDMGPGSRPNHRGSGSGVTRQTGRHRDPIRRGAARRDCRRALGARTAPAPYRRGSPVPSGPSSDFNANSTRRTLGANSSSSRAREGAPTS